MKSGNKFDMKSILVVDETEVPLLLYHGTTDPWYVPTLRHGMGPHFGSIETARTRLDHRAIEFDDKLAFGNDSWLFAAYLRIERPAMMRDVHFDEAGEFIAAAVEGGLISGTETEAAFGKRDGWYSIPDTRNSEMMVTTVAMLKKHGYDGIAYLNQIEGGGTLSWIPFALEQIWEVPEVPLY